MLPSIGAGAVIAIAEGDNSMDTFFATSNNEVYAVDPDGLSSDIEVSQVLLNVGTCEGLRHRSEPVISIQYHSEASPGPLDNVYVFDRFVEMMEEARHG